MLLREWQERFSASVRNGEDAAGLLITPESGPSLMARLAVYRDGYRNRVRAALFADFPLTARLLRRGPFDVLVGAFLAGKKGHEIELGEVSPRFGDFLGNQQHSKALHRAVKLDLLVLEAEQAPDPEAGGENFGLHPSARFFREGNHCYAIWRRGKIVRRERTSLSTQQLLECFQAVAAVAELGERLGSIELDPEFVQSGVTLWTGLGMIVRH